MDSVDLVIKALDERKNQAKEGGEYWRARDIQPVLGYSRWENFEKVINKARMACESAGVDPNNHFRETTKVIAMGKGAQFEQRDFFLSRYACYLVAMNGETTKPEIGTAQTYFAVQTRRQEVFDALTEEERRIQLRERVKDANRKLNSAAKGAGVQRYAIFHDAGYRGLYGLGLAGIKRRKGIPVKEDLLDRAGRTELAANEFRITQAEDKLVRDNINTEAGAIHTHEDVGREVRSAIDKLGGTLPENLLPEPSIKKLIGKRQKKLPPSETDE